MSSYREALTLFDPIQQARIEDVGAVWRSGLEPMVVDAITVEEFFLPPNAMKALLEALDAASRIVNPGELAQERNKRIEIAYKQACYAYQGLGARIDCVPDATSVGRAFDSARLGDRLYDIGIVFARRKRVLDALRSVTDKDGKVQVDPPNSKPIVRLLQSRFYLSAGTAFVTWNSGTGLSPFDFAGAGDAHYIRCCLGLMLPSDPDMLWTFVYRLPPRVPLLRPTIADAAGYRYFKPSSPKDEHGWTRPHSDPRPHLKPVRRPEAVHAKLLLGSVIDTLELKEWT